MSIDTKAGRLRSDAVCQHLSNTVMPSCRVGDISKGKHVPTSKRTRTQKQHAHTHPHTALSSHLSFAMIKVCSECRATRKYKHTHTHTHLLTHTHTHKPNGKANLIKLKERGADYLD